jgi:hypothetical protein
MTIASVVMFQMLKILLTEWRNSPELFLENIFHSPKLKCTEVTNALALPNALAMTEQAVLARTLE